MIYQFESHRLDTFKHLLKSERKNLLFNFQLCLISSQKLLNSNTSFFKFPFFLSSRLQLKIKVSPISLNSQGTLLSQVSICTYDVLISFLLLEFSKLFSKRCLENFYCFLFSLFLKSFYASFIAEHLKNTNRIVQFFCFNFYFHLLHLFLKMNFFLMLKNKLIRSFSSQRGSNHLILNFFLF